MDYMVGGDMRNILEEYGCLENNTARYYIGSLIEAVILLHQQKIIHRDLKPENLLLDKKGHLKLADFGLSEFHKKVFEEPEFRESVRPKKFLDV